MGFSPRWASAAFVREKGRLPTKPLYAESGDGCADSRVTCRDRSISTAFCWACTPRKQKHNVAVQAYNRPQYGVGEQFPATSLMRVGLAFANREHGIEQENTLRRPRGKAAVVGDRRPGVVVQLAENISQ